MSFSYSLGGRVARRLAERAGVFREIYYTAGFSEPFEEYLSKWVTAYILTAPAVTAAAVALHSVLLGYPPVFSAVLSLLVITVYTLIYAAACLYYPVYKRYSRGMKIDSRLPYTLAYFASLAASGMGLDKVVENAVEVEEEKEIAREFSLFLTDTRLLGLDMLTALERRSSRSPSILLSLFLSGLRDAYIVAGNLYEYSAFIARRLLEFKRYELRKIASTVSVIAEAYVTLMVAAPLMFVVMLSIIGMLGGSIGGIPTTLLIAVILAVGAPASAAAILVMLDAVLSRV